jgi:hypothetical protein
MLLLGSPDVIAAAERWRHAAWNLEWFARGLRDGASEFSQANDENTAARTRFYAAARRDLGMVSGMVPDLGSWLALHEPAGTTTVIRHTSRVNP